MNNALKWGLISVGVVLGIGGLAAAANAASGSGGSNGGSGGGGAGGGSGAERCSELDGLEFVEVASDGGDLGRTLPLVVLLHGVNSSPEKIIGTSTTSILPAFAKTKPVRIVAPRGPLAGSDGSSFLTVLSTGDQATFRSEVSAIGPKIGSWIEALAACRPTAVREDGGKSVVVMGFSQGAHVALAASTRLAGVASRVLAVNGWIPADLFGDETAPITWISGDQDQTVPHKRSAGTAKELQDRGLDLRWWPVKGSGHALNGVLRDTVRAELAALQQSPLLGTSGGLVWNRVVAS